MIGIGPGGGIIRIPVWSRPPERDLAEHFQEKAQGSIEPAVGAGHPQGRHDEIQWAFELQSCRGSELVRINDSSQHRRDVALGLGVSFRHLRNQRFARIIGYKSPAQLGSDKTCGRGVFGKDLEHSISIPIPSRQYLAKHGFRTVIMPVWEISELHGLVGVSLEPPDRPAREGPCDGLDIGVGIPTVHAEGMQLEDLTCVILVRAWLPRVGVVQVNQHRRAVGGGGEHFWKLPQRVGADDFAVVHALEEELRWRICEYVEVICPEVDHNLQQLVGAVDLAHDRGGAQFPRDAAVFL